MRDKMKEKWLETQKVIEMVLHLDMRMVVEMVVMRVN